METENIDNNHNEENATESSIVLDSLGEMFIAAPIELGKSIVKNTSEILSSAKESIVEHSSGLVEGATETAGNMAGGIADAIGEAISNIDL